MRVSKDVVKVVLWVLLLAPAPWTCIRDAWKLNLTCHMDRTLAMDRHSLLTTRKIAWQLKSTDVPALHLESFTGKLYLGELQTCSLGHPYALGSLLTAYLLPCWGRGQAINKQLTAYEKEQLPEAVPD